MRGTSTVDFSGIVIDRKELSPRKSWYPPSSDLEDGDVIPYPETADSDQFFWQKTTKDPNVDPYAKRNPQVHKQIQITSGGSISSVSTSDSTPKTHTSDRTEGKDNDDSPTGRIGNTPFGKLLYALGVLLSLIFILLVVIIIVKSGSSEDEVVTSADSASSPTTSQTSPTFPTTSPTYHPTVKITDQPTMNPTTSLPTLSPTTHPPTRSPTLSPTVSEEGIIEFIKSQSAMSSEYLEDDSSPQSRALEWLLSEPSTFTLFNSKEWKVLQRWAMAVLYYSTGGELWWDSSDWLTSVDECQWSMGDTESRICDDEGRILQLSLRFNNLVGTLPDELVLLSDSLGKPRSVILSIHSCIPLIHCQFLIFTFLVFSVHLYLDNGIIQGSFPSAYAQLTKLGTSLFICDGILYSSLSTSYELMFCSILLCNSETLFLQSNVLTGTLPEELNSLESLGM